MASLQPPVPAIAASDFTEHTGSVMSSREPHNRFGRWRRTIGLLMLASVVFLWTASNFLASAVLADDTYNKPYFLTYFNTAFFIIPLIPILASKAHRQPEELRQWKTDGRTWIRKRFHSSKPENSNEDGQVGTPLSASRRPSVSDSRELLLGDHTEPSQVPNNKVYAGKLNEQLTIWETTKLSFEFCILWFLANYWVAASLEYTTVASSTILTSTSSVFTLLFGVIFGVEKFILRKLMGVLASLAGIVLISSVDLSGNRADAGHRGDFPKKSLKEIAIGDALAFLSAVMYGIYAVFMKKRIADESLVSMPLFFGLVGLINVLLLWPGFFILHWTDVERFMLPPTGRVTIIIVANSIASLVADMAWAYAVLLTSPIVVTVGLSMTIPLSLLGEVVIHSQTAGPIYWVGAVIVITSFVFINHEEKKDEQTQDVREHDTPRQDRASIDESL
ncbi:hypothetical protein LTR37_016812 [Vermiconidia calcicola]|uniref:Uncharacterized protein n=1 Tax=Vermiconidia calcicola TaxID=1690605 RepID=A0ACC3MM01_9PEZI|nr:hypothetical protein LTR37_016812 [Vermiconidia calcicola]